MAETIKYYLGIDIGGMTVKAIVLDADGKPVIEDSVKTDSELGGDAMCTNIAGMVNALIARLGASKSQVKAGAGCPGMIDSENGIVVFAGNLNLKNYPLGAKLKELTGLDISITNDANAAALGEAKFGAGREYSDSILVTLGTGIGGGIIIGGKLFEGYKSAGAEIGHMVIERHGNHCTCGRRGCFETYCSATALIKRTRYQMEENPVSAMWTKYTSETATAKTAFEFADVDLDAKEVVEWYIKYLSCGITNLVNIFRPQVVMLGGGISGQGERLTEPLQRLVDKEIFGSTDYAPVKIVTASLGAKAGAYGAAALAMEGSL